jgi:hypothetical protein
MSPGNLGMKKSLPHEEKINHILNFAIFIFQNIFRDFLTINIKADLCSGYRLELVSYHSFF